MKKIIWEKWPFSALWKPLDPRLILEKLKTFRFSSIKSSRSVVSSFWSYRKFLLSQEIILGTFNECWKCLEDYLRSSFKNNIFCEILFLTHKTGQTRIKKSFFGKKHFSKLDAKKFSRHFQHTLKVSRMVSWLRRNFL